VSATPHTRPDVRVCAHMRFQKIPNCCHSIPTLRVDKALRPALIRPNLVSFGCAGAHPRTDLVGTHTGMYWSRATTGLRKAGLAGSGLGHWHWPSQYIPSIPNAPASWLELLVYMYGHSCTSWYQPSL
jgi:hypothetical protein